MSELTSEWCRDRARLCEIHEPRLYAALRIAARVLDEGAVEGAKNELSKHIRVDATGLAPAVAQCFLIGFDEAAQAVITYLKGEGDGR